MAARPTPCSSRSTCIAGPAPIGGNLGYQWGDVNGGPLKPSGISGGIQGGYNWQFGQFVVGAEADIQASGSSHTFAAWKFSNPWFGTLRGHAGFAMNNILIYGTGGLAFGGLRAEVLNLSETRWATGWTLGVGAEIGITQNWSAKVEYSLCRPERQAVRLDRPAEQLVQRRAARRVNYKF